MKQNLYLCKIKKNSFMKQVKFLFVALMAIVMSVSVTSCMNTDNNTQV
ncbi:secreted protein, partial [gut metagenome]